MSAVKLAILAAPDDAAGRRELEGHLVQLRRSKRYVVTPPEDAEVLVPLVSAALVAHDELWDFLTAARARGVRIWPVRFGACDVDSLFGIVWTGGLAPWISELKGPARPERWCVIQSAIDRGLRAMEPAPIPL